MGGIVGAGIGALSAVMGGGGGDESKSQGQSTSNQQGTSFGAAQNTSQGTSFQQAASQGYNYQSSQEAARADSAAREAALTSSSAGFNAAKTIFDEYGQKAISQLLLQSGKGTNQASPIYAGGYAAYDALLDSMGIARYNQGSSAFAENEQLKANYEQAIQDYKSNQSRFATSEADRRVEYDKQAAAKQAMYKGDLRGYQAAQKQDALNKSVYAQQLANYEGSKSAYASDKAAYETRQQQKIDAARQQYNTQAAGQNQANSANFQAQQAAYQHQQEVYARAEQLQSAYRNLLAQGYTVAYDPSGGQGSASHFVQNVAYKPQEAGSSFIQMAEKGMSLTGFLPPGATGTSPVYNRDPSALSGLETYRPVEPKAPGTIGDYVDQGYDPYQSFSGQAPIKTFSDFTDAAPDAKDYQMQDFQAGTFDEQAPTAPTGTFNPNDLTDPATQRQKAIDAVKNTPGYSFGLNEGLGAVQRSAAGRGILQSTGTLKNINQYANDYATTKFTDYQNQLAQIAQSSQNLMTSMNANNLQAGQGAANLTQQTAASLAQMLLGSNQSWQVSPVTQQSSQTSAGQSYGQGENVSGSVGQSQNTAQGSSVQGSQQTSNSQQTQSSSSSSGKQNPLSAGLQAFSQGLGF